MLRQIGLWVGLLGSSLFRLCGALELEYVQFRNKARNILEYFVYIIGNCNSKLYHRWLKCFYFILIDMVTLIYVLSNKITPRRLPDSWFKNSKNMFCLLCVFVFISIPHHLLNNKLTQTLSETVSRVPLVLQLRSTIIIHRVVSISVTVKHAVLEDSLHQCSALCFGTEPVHVLNMFCIKFSVVVRLK